MKIESQEQFFKVIVALRETVNLIAAERSYADHLQDVAWLETLSAHRDKLTAAIRTYAPLSNAA